MLSDNEKKELLTKAKGINEEVRDLRKQLAEINIEKESAYQKKEQLYGKIRDQITTITKSKSQRNTLSGQVRENKRKRDALNKSIQDKINEAKGISKEKSDIQKKFNIKNDPSKLKEQITLLEQKIETEVMSFKNEQAIMKKIKEFKKQYKESRKISDTWDKLHKVNAEITELKTEANQLHRKVQDSAAESQEHHKEMITVSKDIDSIRDDQKKQQNEYITHKKEFDKFNLQLKAKLMEINEINKKLDVHRLQVSKIKKEKVELTLAEKQREVESKIKSRKKLTTEDLLVLQRQG